MRSKTHKCAKLQYNFASIFQKYYGSRNSVCSRDSKCLNYICQTVQYWYEMMHWLLSILHIFLSISQCDFNDTLKMFVPEGNLSWNGMSKTSAKFKMLDSCSVESVPVQGRKPLLVFLFNQGMCSMKLLS